VIARKALSKLKWKLRTPSSDEERPSSQVRREIQIRSYIYVCNRLRAEMADSDVQSEKISQLIAEYEHAISILRSPSPSITALTRKAEPDLDAMKLALRIELEQIQLAYDEGRLSRGAAQRMRENVYLMQVDLTDNV
jgi:CPA1 family monovalent cation:H+ antiporter